MIGTVFDNSSLRLTTFSMRTYEWNIFAFGCSEIASSYNDSPVVFSARDGFSFDVFLFSFVGLMVLATLLPFASLPFSVRVLFEDVDETDVVSDVSSTGSCLICEL